MPPAPAAHSLCICHECDLLQRETPLAVGAAARCARCSAVLYRRTRDGLERTLAFTLAAIVVFFVANVFPIVGLEVQGQHTAATLFGAVLALQHQNRELVAGLVFVTTMLVPAIQLAAWSYLLLPLRLGRAPRGFAVMFRLVQAVRPWSMVEVFILGLLVSLAKLSHVAQVVPGIALWSFGALMLLMAAGAASFDVRELWQRRAAVA